jgi:hypothetical protein
VVREERLGQNPRVREIVSGDDRAGVHRAAVGMLRRLHAVTGS